jgi:hypothetical protein
MFVTWLSHFKSDVIVTPRYFADGTESVSRKVIIPSLFFFYINDMSDDIKSTVRLFADDTIVYLSVLR